MLPPDSPYSRWPRLPQVVASWLLIEESRRLLQRTAPLVRETSRLMVGKPHDDAPRPPPRPPWTSP